MVEKMVENRLMWFGHVERRPIDSVVRRVDQIEDSQITRGRGRPRKTIRKYFEINELDRNKVYDRTLWRNLIHIAGPTWWEKAWWLLLCVCESLVIGTIK